MKRILLFGAAVLLTACGQDLTPQQRAVEEEAVNGRLQAWDRAMDNRWLDSLAAIYDHSASMSVAWPDGHRTRGWDQERLAENEFFSSISFMNLGVQDPVTVVLSPDVAVTTFHHSTDVIVSGVRQPVTSGQATFVWVRDPAEKLEALHWKLHTAQWSVTPVPAATAAPAATKAPAARRR